MGLGPLYSPAQQRKAYLKAAYEKGFSDGLNGRAKRAYDGDVMEVYQRGYRIGIQERKANRE